MPEAPQELPALVRARDLRSMGLTRVDAERVMHLAGKIQLPDAKAVYCHRADVERVLAEHAHRRFV